MTALPIHAHQASDSMASPEVSQPTTARPCSLKEASTICRVGGVEGESVKGVRTAHEDHPKRTRVDVCGECRVDLVESGGANRIRQLLRCCPAHQA